MQRNILVSIVWMLAVWLGLGLGLGSELWLGFIGRVSVRLVLASHFHRAAWNIDAV